MNIESTHSCFLAEPDEDAIRHYAYQLYLQGGSVSGRDFDHWLEATACLKAKIALDQPVFHPHGTYSGLEGETLHALPSDLGPRRTHA
jgi:hypothetical protein